MGTAFDNFMAQRHRDKQQNIEHAARVKLVAFTCSLGGLVVGGLTGFGITYGVIKNKEKKQEPQAQTQVEESVAQIETKGYELTFDMGNEKVSANKYFENEMSL